MSELRDTMLENVQEDRNLKPEEKETLLQVAKDEERVSVYTQHAAICRRLLMLDHTDIECVHLSSDASEKSLTPSEYNGEDIVGLEATIPVGALSIKGETRESSLQSEIVSQGDYYE